MTVELKTLQNLFKKIDRNYHDEREVFLDVIRLGACMVHQSSYRCLFQLPKDKVYEEVEEVRKEYVKKFSDADLEVINDILNYIEDHLMTHHTDILGEYYMSIGANKDVGQFFTPFPVSYLMAQITFGSEHQETLEKQGYLSLQEPACGAGGMVLAFAKVMKDHGCEPSSQLYVDATDIESNAFYMCYLQLSLAGISGVVRHGDTLRMEHWRHWETPSSRVMRGLGMGVYGAMSKHKTEKADVVDQPIESEVNINLSSEGQYGLAF